MATYTEMVGMVRDWSNRDVEVLSDQQISTMLTFAADEAYRQLKIPALEAVYTYRVPGGTSELIIPSNLTETIQLRMKDNNSVTGYVVYESKSDIRSFYNEYTFKYSDFFYTREQNKFIFCPETTGAETFELYYYGRQPAIDATYSITAGNVDLAIVANSTDTDVLPALIDTEVLEGAYLTYYKEDTDGATRATFTITRSFPNTNDSDTDVVTKDTDLSITGFFVPKEAPNWLRDQNERIILFGALAEAFDFLQEIEQAQVYRQKFISEIQALNQEEKMRMSRGGNIQTHFQAPLL